MQRGSSNGTEHADWNTQRERLAAYLDDELASVEREQLERHLADCADCQRALAEQREVRMLLRALPTPRVPRSFALPDGEPAALPVRLRARHGALPVPLARVLQWSGSVAASVGLVLVLGSTVLGLGQHQQAASTMSAPSTGSSQRAPRDSEHPQTPIASGAVNQPTVTITPRTPLGPTQPTQAAQHTPASNEGGSAQPPQNIVPVVGTGLTVGGLCLLVIGWLARRLPGQRRR